VASKVRLALESRGLAVEGARVLVLGVAYKAGVGIVEESPAFPLASELRLEGAQVRYHDPLVPLCELGESRPLDAEQLAETDVAVLLVAQPGVDLELLVESEVLVVDTRAALRGSLRGQPRYFPA
jgi:UDP-N-acetyl-D-glucosamine dehydrogenase